MKSNLIFHSTAGMTSEEWLSYRQSGIGGSETATVLGLNPYKASIELFYEKLGAPIFRPENLAMFLGKETEPLNADIWQYWPIDDKGMPLADGEAIMIQNFREGKIVRKCHRVNAYVRNPDFPWLFVSLDRLINKQGQRGEGVLECKNISGYAADQWEAGFPPGYVIQIQHQLIVTALLWGESSVMRDGRKYFVLPFEYHKDICDTIIAKTKAFWDKVVRGRELMTAKFEAERSFNHMAAQAIDAEIQQLEPEPDGSDAFSAFLKEKYKIALPGERPGDDADLLAARESKSLKERIKELSEAATQRDNELRSKMGHLDCDRLDFGKDGYVSWKQNTNGVRMLLNKSKPAPVEVSEEVQK